MMQNMPESGIAVVGRILSQARISRGLSLDDVERDTRIAKRFLEALERDDFNALPAPVYCRAFIRTYSQYLGLDPKEVMRFYPEHGAEPTPLSPLPQVSKAPPPALSMNWVIAGGVVIVFLLAVGLLFKISSGGGNQPAANNNASVLATQQPSGEGSENVNPNTALQPTASSESTDAQPVAVPDVTGATGLDALPKIRNAGLTYVVFRLYDDQIPAGLVVSQSPAPSDQARTGDPVTLVISRGPRQ